MNRSMTEEAYLHHIIQDQLRRHQGFQVDDLYKMIYQTTYGGEHFLHDKTKARKMLQEEWENTERIPKGESLLEIIDPRGEIMRVNLRIFKKVGGTVRQIFDLFVRSAREFEEDRERLVQYWETIMNMAERGEIPFSKDILEDFYIEMGRKGFPVIHHSESYIDANRPAYRIVLKKLWEGFEEESAEQ